MVSPCKCTGSVKYIHTRCRRLWVLHEGQIIPGRLNCSICNEPLFTLESMPIISSSADFILCNPLWFSSLIQYVCMGFYAHTAVKPIDIVARAQLIVLILYMIVFGCSVRIVHMNHYVQVILDRYSYRYPIAHLYLLYSFFYEGSFPMIVAANLWMSTYWREHIYILQHINDKIIKN